MAHKEDKIIGLLVIDLDRRANLAILGACWASDKRQDCDWDLRRRKHREKREREMMYKKTQLYLLKNYHNSPSKKIAIIGEFGHWDEKNGEVQIRLTLWKEIFLILWIVCIFGKMPYVTRPLYIPWGQPEPLQLYRYPCPHFGWCPEPLVKHRLYRWWQICTYELAGNGWWRQIVVLCNLKWFLSVWYRWNECVHSHKMAGLSHYPVSSLSLQLSLIVETGYTIVLKKKNLSYP